MYIYMELTGHIPFKWVKEYDKMVSYIMIQYHTVSYIYYLYVYALYHTLWCSIIHIQYLYALYDTVSYIMMQYDTYIICICTVWYSVYMYIQSIIQSTIQSIIQSIIQYHIVLYCVCTWSYPWFNHYPFPKCCPMNKIILKKCALYIIL